MGNIETKLVADGKLAIRTVSGEVTASDIRAAIETFNRERPPLLILWDFTAGGLSNVTTEELRELAAFTMGYTKERVGGKTALVFVRDYAFGLGRLFATHMELHEDPVVNRTFHDRQQAIDWLLG